MHFLIYSKEQKVSKTRFFSSSREIEERLLLNCLRKQEELDDEEKVREIEFFETNSIF